MAISPSVFFQDYCSDLAVSSSNFIPTVTAISTSPDLQWLVQPTLVSSVAPSQTRAPHPYGVPAPSAGAYSRAGPVKTLTGGRAQSIGRRGKVEQVSCASAPSGDGGAGGWSRGRSLVVETGVPSSGRGKPQLGLSAHPEPQPEPGSLAPSHTPIVPPQEVRAQFLTRRVSRLLARLARAHLCLAGDLILNASHTLA